MKSIMKGEIVLISSGEYSDYIESLFKAKADISTDQVRNDYINLHPDQTAQYQFKEDMFVDYLLEKKLLEEISFKEWYLGTYSKISTMDVTEGTKLFR